MINKFPAHQLTPSLSDQSIQDEKRLNEAGKFTGGGDDLFIITAIVLTIFGLVMVYSSSGYKALAKGLPNWHFFWHQFKILIMGIGLFMIGFKTKPIVWHRWVKLGVIAWVIIMAAQLVLPISVSVNGAKRWLNLGFFTLQSSDVARILIIVFLARLFGDAPELAHKPNLQLSVCFIPIVLMMVLTLLQPNFSTTAVLVLITIIMLFLAGLPFRYFLLIIAVAIGALTFELMRHPYQIERILGFVTPLKNIYHDQYQIWHALVAFARGGLFGVGFGNGSQKMLYLPESHSDFIVAIIGEEFGLLGTTAVLAAFFILFIRGVKISVHQPNRYQFLLAAGLTTSITIYALINIGVATRLLPVTGLPLPLISSGGTSLVLTLWAVGVIWRLSQEARFDHR